MMVVGADGCRAGWFAVTLTKDGPGRPQIFLDVFNLWREHTEAASILLDIPIGLRESGPQERLCDLRARQLLGRRGSSVFPVPCRDAVYAEAYPEACDINQHLTGRRLSRQTWNITPKIRQVDELLSGQASARLQIREVHPEVCFWALAGGHPMRHSKKKKSTYMVIRWRWYTGLTSCRAHTW